MKLKLIKQRKCLICDRNISVHNKTGFCIPHSGGNFRQRIMRGEICLCSHDSNRHHIRRPHQCLVNSCKCKAFTIAYFEDRTLPSYLIDKFAEENNGKGEK